MKVMIKVTRAEGSDTSLPLPRYATVDAAGADLSAQLPDGPLMLAPGQRALVPTGLQMAIPRGFEVQIRPRSGLALQHGVTLVNTPGTIDSDYRGPIGVLMINHGEAPFEITHGMRIAQMVVAPVVQCGFTISGHLSDTARGNNGFGSTGTAA